MHLFTVEHPKNEIISLQEAKNYLMIDHNFDDNLIKMLIKSTREALETMIQKSVIYRVYEYVVESDSVSHTRSENRGINNLYDGTITIPLPQPPIVKILGVKMRINTVVRPSIYHLEKDDDSCNFILHYRKLSEKRIRYPIMIRYRAGMTASPSNVPYQLKLANLMLIANAYRGRYSSEEKNIISQEVKALITPFLNLKIF